MICPKCGTTIPEGKLYCEKCGEEIRMVPEFEPEIEYSIKESLSGIGEMVEEEKTDKEVKKKSNKIVFGVLPYIKCMVLSVLFFFLSDRTSRRMFCRGKNSGCMRLL